MAVVTITPEPRFLLRPGPNDHKLIDGLLSPGMFDAPVHLDGLVIDAPHRKLFRETRDKLPSDATVLVDPQAYRLEAPSHRGHHRLADLEYAPEIGTMLPQELSTERTRRVFVRKVLDAQDELRPSHYIAPAFYAPKLNSEAAEVNQVLLSETLSQTGGRVFATICGSYTGLCADETTRARLVASLPSGVHGVFLLISPFSAYTASPTKIANYLSLLSEIQARGLVAYASRQAPFGLGCMAFGIAGFDSGVGIAETFDYSQLIRPRPVNSPEKGRSGRPKRFYLPQLFTHLSSSAMNELLKFRNLAGSVTCSHACCRYSQTNGILVRNREHFVYSRLAEITELRRLPLDWRQEEFRSQLVRARQLADSIARAAPAVAGRRFRHLDVWNRAFSEFAVRSRVTAGVRV